jgi:triosephosphate isomerase
LNSPFILLNYTTYTQGTGSGAVEIAKVCKTVSEESCIEVAVAPQLPDIYRVASEVEFLVFSQYMDGIGAESFTGHVFGKCTKYNGTVEAVSDYSKWYLTAVDIEVFLEEAKKLEFGKVVCTNNVPTTLSGPTFSHNYFAAEPSVPISSGIPISKDDPDVVSGSVEAVAKINPAVKGRGNRRKKDFKDSSHRYCDYLSDLAEEFERIVIQGTLLITLIIECYKFVRYIIG